MHRLNSLYCVTEQVLSQLLSVLSLVLSKCNHSYCSALRLGAHLTLMIFIIFANLVNKTQFLILPTLGPS